MITPVKCASCGRDQSAPSSRAGQDVPCRFCGDPIRVPADAAPYRSAIGSWRTPETAPPPSSALGGWGRPAPAPAPRSPAPQSPAPQSPAPQSPARQSPAPRAPAPAPQASAGPPRPPTGRPLGGPSAPPTWSSPARAPDSPPAEQPEPRPQIRVEPRPPQSLSEGVQRLGRLFAGGSPGSSAPRPGVPQVTGRHAQEQRAGRPQVRSGARGAGAVGALFQGLNSDSEAEKLASTALVVSFFGWVLCFPMGLLALYLVHQAKLKALAEGREVPRSATIATIVAASNLVFVFFGCCLRGTH